MKQEKILSIVIPVYNMERYFDRCLKSVVLPELSGDIEIIVVNDGSTDNSLSIAQSYKDRFPQLVVVIDKPNGHYGSCINVALKIAGGRYFRPLDADDWFDHDAFVYCVHALQNMDVDVVFTNFLYEYAAKRTNRKAFSTKDIQNIAPELKHDFVHFQFKNAGKIFKMHSMMYRTELLRTMNFRCTEGICYTDTEYCFYPLEYVRTFTCIDRVLYRYLIGREEQTVSVKSFVKNKEHIYTILCRIIEYLQETPAHDNRTKQYVVARRAINFYYAIVLIFIEKNKHDDEKLAAMDAEIKKIDSDLYDSLNNSRFRTARYIHLWRTRHIHCGETKSYKLISSVYTAVKYLYRTIALRLKTA
jgi:glycosyltransferase involved in cell wall biosynthesis